VDIENLKIQIRETLEPCIKCGLCKSLCPVFKELREEYYSPRGRAVFLSDETLDKIIFKCNLCKACEKKCPLKIKVWEATQKARELMVLKGKELPENKEMIKNIRETGNPFGKNPDEKGKLYCC
jgi:Fe-S oxidoreductase